MRSDIRRQRLIGLCLVPTLLCVLLVGQAQANLMLDLSIAGISTDNGVTFNPVADPKNVLVNPGDQLQLEVHATLGLANQLQYGMQYAFFNIAQNIGGRPAATAGTFVPVGDTLAIHVSGNDTAGYLGPFDTLVGGGTGLPMIQDLNGDGANDIGGVGATAETGRFLARAGSVVNTKATSGYDPTTGFDLGYVVWKAGTAPGLTTLNTSFGTDMPIYSVALFKEAGVSYIAGGANTGDGWSRLAVGPDVNVTVAGVPEPATLILLGGALAFGGLVFVRRRKA